MNCLMGKQAATASKTQQSPRQTTSRGTPGGMSGRNCMKIGTHAVGAEEGGTWSSIHLHMQLHTTTQGTHITHTQTHTYHRQKCEPKHFLSTTSPTPLAPSNLISCLSVSLSLSLFDMPSSHVVPKRNISPETLSPRASSRERLVKYTTFTPSSSRMAPASSPKKFCSSSSHSAADSSSASSSVDSP